MGELASPTICWRASPATTKPNSSRAASWMPSVVLSRSTSVWSSSVAFLMVSSSDWRLSISVRWPNHEVKGKTKNELPNEKTTTAKPMSKATRPRTFGTMRSDRGVGRVRSETADNFARAVFPAPFFVVFFTRPGGRGILEVLFPRAIPTFCPF